MLNLNWRIFNCISILYIPIVLIYIFYLINIRFLILYITLIISQTLLNLTSPLPLRRFYKLDYKRYHTSHPPIKVVQFAKKKKLQCMLATASQFWKLEDKFGHWNIKDQIVVSQTRIRKMGHKFTTAATANNYCLLPCILNHTQFAGIFCTWGSKTAAESGPVHAEQPFLCSNPCLPTVSLP